MFLSESKNLRAQAVRQAITRNQPSTPELAVLTQYVLGNLSLEQTNSELRQHGRTILAAPVAA
ncbi:hypothetical protein E4631_18035 [Hymenobacter sp. UV11]|uniref:hypothetical protein n=1 Tax=Hymenobacter sp. UV11 TaxID=1849735 RepID=UPI00105E842D|nr:hypothetical protein [Hymenobacter sp. UV11]TFZ64886.1 hypothetical protein E4631_18035 [Hymenobacter sp. UV11]